MRKLFQTKSDLFGESTRLPPVVVVVLIAFTVAVANIVTLVAIGYALLLVELWFILPALVPLADGFHYLFRFPLARTVMIVVLVLQALLGVLLLFGERKRVGVGLLLGTLLTPVAVARGLALFPPSF